MPCIDIMRRGRSPVTSAGPHSEKAMASSNPRTSSCGSSAHHDRPREQPPRPQPAHRRQARHPGPGAASGAGIRALDLRGGSGELLCAWARDRGITGTGVDISTVFTERARARAVELDVAGRVTFVHGDAPPVTSRTSGSISPCASAPPGSAWSPSRPATLRKLPERRRTRGRGAGTVRPRSGANSPRPRPGTPVTSVSTWAGGLRADVPLNTARQRPVDAADRTAADTARRTAC